MKILLTNPGGERYGSDRMLAATARALLAEGHRVEVALGASGPLSEELRELGARVHVIAAPLLRRGRLSPRGVVGLAAETFTSAGPMLRALRRIRPDAVVVNTLTIPLWVLCARAVGIPVAVHLHEAEGQLPPAVARLLYSGLRPATLLVANSEYTRDVLVGAWPRAAARALVLRNCVAGPPSITPPRARLEGPVRLAYVGRLSARKGPDLAIAAVQLLRSRGLDVRLQVAGDVFEGNEDFRRQLEAGAGPLLDDGVVAFSGAVEEPWETLAGADIALVPSLLPESFGNTAVEAGLAARPVIVSEIGGLVEAAAQRRSARLVAPGDAEAIAQVVDEWATRWAEVGADAQAEAADLSERYGFARYRAAWAQVVRELAPE